MLEGHMVKVGVEGNMYRVIVGRFARKHFVDALSMMVWCHDYSCNERNVQCCETHLPLRGR